MPNPNARREFWITSNKFLQRLYVSPLVTVAAIRGACPAGGCCLSLCCDHRVMSRDAGYIGECRLLVGQRAGVGRAESGSEKMQPVPRCPGHGWDSRALLLPVHARGAPI